MDQDTQNIIATQMAALPEEVKAAIVAVDYPRKLEVITKNNKLLIDQAGKLETETTLVMLGLEPLEDYVANLMRELDIPKERALAIARDADELIFKSIRESLQKMNEEMIAADNAELAKEQGHPSKEEILAGIEKPEQIKSKEGSISVSSLPSNAPKTPAQLSPEGVEMKNDLLPEIYPEPTFPATSVLSAKTEPYHENISPVENIVRTKMTDEVIVPKEKIVIEEKTKLPEKSKPSDSSDPYREPIS